MMFTLTVTFVSYVLPNVPVGCKLCPVNELPLTRYWHVWGEGELYTSFGMCGGYCDVLGGESWAYRGIGVIHTCIYTYITHIHDFHNVSDHVHVMSTFPVTCMPYLFHIAPEWCESCPVNELFITRYCCGWSLG